MLFIDKYRDEINYYFNSNTLNKLMMSFDPYSNIINNSDIRDVNKFKEILKNINTNEINYDNFQHLLIYGPDGCGKEFIVNNIIEKIYGKEQCKIKDMEYTITEYSNKKTTVTIKQSNSHIIIEPNNNGFDKYLIKEIIQEYAKREILNIFTKRKIFKVIVIDKIDNLSYYAQASLRRTMEKYADRCKFIFISNQISKIIEPLKSRCLPIRIPLPSKMKQLEFILNIMNKEQLKLNEDQIKSILHKTNNNINNILWELQSIKYNINNNSSWENILDKIIDQLLILKKDNSYLNTTISKAREYFYILYISNLKFNSVMRLFFIKLFNKVDNKYKLDIINETSILLNKIQNGSRNIIHIESYILRLIKILI